MRTNHQIVDAVGQMHFEGNVIPHNWFKHITLDNGKPDLSGIIILSEIVYWYRPTLKKDEVTGQVIGAKKRFKADLLQRTYDSFSEQFGLTKRQAQEAMARLEKLGLVKRHLRTIIANGTKLGNVLFIELIPDNLRAITFESDPYHVKTGEVSHQNETGITLKRETNTEITTKITTENTTERGADKPPSPPSSLIDMNFLRIKEHFESQVIYQQCNYKQAQQIGELVDEYDHELIIKAMETAVQRGKPNLFYIGGILRNLRADGITNIEQLNAREAQSNAAHRQRPAVGGPSNRPSFKEQFGVDVGF